MIPAGPEIPDPIYLGREGRVFFLAWIEGELRLNGGVSVEAWREAYGRAADYQTAHNARIVLARGAA